ncbi:Ankyrin repeat-containing domain protein [Naviculisporaceae sp. PSN 640]
MEPVSIVTSIITLSGTLRTLVGLVNDYTSADETVSDIRSTCEFADIVLNNIKEQLDAHIRPTSLAPDNANGSGSPVGTRSSAVDLSDVLRNNVKQLQIDVNVLLKEVETLFDPDRPASRVGEWTARGTVVWRRSYLQGMHARIQSKLTQLQLVQNNLTAQATNAAFRQHGSHENVIETIGHIFRSTSHRRTSTDPYSRRRLIEAVKNGDDKEAEKLLQEVDPNFASDDNEALFPLHYAAKRADDAMIMLLLNHGARVDCSHSSPTPLILALQNTDVAPALTLISRGANILQADPKGAKQTPLHISVARNHYHIVQVLLGCHVNVNVRDKEGRTPLFECVRSTARHLVPDDVGVLRILLDQGANPVLGRYSDNFNPLHLAAQMGYVEDLQLLLEATKALGIDPDSATAWDKLGRSALWYAASEGQVEAMKVLIRFGADAKRHFQRDHQRPTALWAMATCSTVEDTTAGVLALLNAGARPDEGRNSKGQTLLAVMCESGNVCLASLLLSKGADPRIPDHDGKQPIHHAARNGDQETTALLLRCESHRVDINSRDSSGATPLILAAMNGHDHLVKFLTRYEPRPADWKVTDNYGSDAFYLACATGHTFCAIYLHALGAEINRPNNRGNTPLHIAARRGNFDTVLWLLRMGADKYVRSSTDSGNGATPDEVARTSASIEDPGLREAVASLIKHWTPDQAAGVRWTVTSNLG